MPEARGVYYEIIRSTRKTIAIEITRDGKVLVRCPYLTNPQRIYTFVSSKSEWIKKHLEKKQNTKKEPPFTNEEINTLADAALIDIPKRVKFYAERMGLRYGNITIKNQLTRWGSCSSLNNLNFNCVLMLTPEIIRDYVVVHELCHLKEMNHSKKFWAEVANVMPEYKIYEKWLKENGGALISRLRR